MMYFDNNYIEERIKLYQQTNDKAIIDELVPVFNKLISGVICKYKLLRRNSINDDLSQEAWVGIVEAAKKWDKERGDAFSFFTAIVKNKIFWYLKNHYQDTSLNSDNVQSMSIDDVEKHYEIIDENETANEMSMLRDYIKKLTLEELNLYEDEENVAILNSLKEKFSGCDNITYSDLIKETQKEIGTPKKKVKAMLDAIYLHYIGD